MSFLKQILNPFVEFDEKKEKDPVKENNQPVIPANQAPPAVPSANENAQHPLITGKAGTSNASNNIPSII